MKPVEINDFLAQNVIGQEESLRGLLRLRGDEESGGDEVTEEPAVFLTARRRERGEAGDEEEKDERRRLAVDRVVARSAGAGVRA